MIVSSFTQGAARVTIACGLVFSSLPLCADKPKKEPDKELTLQRIFTKEEFKAKSFSVQWLKTGSAYTFLKKVDESDSESPRQIWLQEPGLGEPRLLVPATLLTPRDSDTLAIQGYTFSDDLNLLLIYTNSQRVWRANTRGDYWVLNRTTNELRQLGGDCEPASLMFAKLSPKGTHVAYVRDQNIFLEGLSDHSIRPLTTSPSETIFNGKFDWVYEEELGIRDGFRWSPDGSAIAYWQFDESGVRTQPLLDHVSGLYPKVTEFGYPKVGERNASCRIGIVEIKGDKTTWMKIPGKPRENYLARMEWMKDSGRIVVQQLNRAQNRNRVILANRNDGATETIFHDKDAAWVHVNAKMTWLEDESAFTWISERDGWQHLYLVSRDGKKITCLTPGEFDVIDLVRVDDANKWAYFIASPEDPSQRYLYRVGLDGKHLKRLTPAREKRGSHSYRISPDGKVAVATSSNTDSPPITRLVSLPKHKTLKALEKNQKLHRRIARMKLSPAEFFDVPIGEGVSLPARCIKPPNFNAAKKYPLLIYVYGEPAGQVVRDSWGGSGGLWHQMLAQQGYVVMSFDNRGTRAPLGRKWRKAAYKKIGILPPKDQAAAVRAVLKSRPYLDPGRVGTWGWSGGGSMSLNAIFKYPDLYHTAIAVASVPDQRHYDTIYQERYMGTPQDNARAFRRGSPINFAQKLKGNLLIIHGAVDDNCHYQTYLKLADKLIRHNKQFSMMTYPRGTHAIKEGKNTRRHLYETMTRFLNEHLPPNP